MTVNYTGVNARGTTQLSTEEERLVLFQLTAVLGFGVPPSVLVGLGVLGLTGFDQPSRNTPAVAQNRPVRGGGHLSSPARVSKSEGAVWRALGRHFFRPVFWLNYV